MGWLQEARHYLEKGLAVLQEKVQMSLPAGIIRFWFLFAAVQYRLADAGLLKITDPNYFSV